MTKRQATVNILCEDLQQQVFARSFLIKQGFEPRKIRLVPLPDGQGSGEQYVRKLYLEEVKAQRSMSTYRSVSLVVIIDADTGTSTERINQLDRVLDENSLPKRQNSEKIAIFVPKRNIETWIHYLMGEIVNEENAYPKFPQAEGSCKPSVEALASKCQQAGLADDAPPSMQIACTELQRILPPS